MISLKKVAKGLGIDSNYLKGLVVNKDKFYQSYYIPKKKRKKRQIDAPNYEIKAIQSWIHDNILISLKTSSRAIGYKRNKSIKDNAEFHIGSKYIMCLDIQNFFTSIKIDKVEKVFKRIIKHNDKICNDLAKICTFRGYLPQGGVTSPILSNLVFTPVDKEIIELCNNKNAIYSRYSDDLTFSSNNFSELKEILPLVEMIVNKYGFYLNSTKTRYLTGKGRKVVTGIILNSGRMTIGRKRKREIRAMLYNNIIKKDSSVDISKMIGKIAFLKNIEPRYYYSRIKSYRNKLLKKLKDK